MKLTDEQKNILQLIKQGHSLVKVYAYAGAGKTSTLVEIAKDNLDKRILYLAFSKAIQMEASKKFPKNTQVRTAHSLAWFYIVKKKDYALRNKDYRLIELRDILDEDNFLLLKSIKGSLASFFYSDFDTIDEFFEKGKYYNADEEHIKEEDIKEGTKQLYSLMKNKEIEITHDFYLKEFQLELKQKKIRLKPYDIILVDECQDLSPVIYNIVRYLPAKQRVFVGDNSQSIFAFRGAVNALQRIEKGEVGYLSNSFRVCPSVAEKADFILREFKLQEVPFKGLNKREPEIKTIAFLGRTNATIIKKFSDLLDNEVSLDEISFIRNPYEVFGLVLNVCNLLSGDELDDEYKFLEKFGTTSAKELEDIAKKLEDIELLFALKLRKKFGCRRLFALRNKAFKCFNNPDAKYFLTTAHTSKGLEFDKVVLLEDFTFNFLIYLVKKDDNTRISELTVDEMVDNFIYNIKHNLKVNSIEEIHLLYVAITRARYLVELPLEIILLFGFKNLREILEELREDLIEREFELMGEKKKIGEKNESVFNN